MSQIIFSDANFSSNKLINLPDLDGLVTWTYLGNGTNDNIDVYHNATYSNLSFNGSTSGPVYAQGYAYVDSNSAAPLALTTNLGDSGGSFSVLAVVQFNDIIQYFMPFCMRGTNNGGVFLRVGANSTYQLIDMLSTTHGTNSITSSGTWNNEWKYIAYTYDATSNTSVIYDITEGTSNTRVGSARLAANDAAIMLGAALAGNTQNAYLAVTSGSSMSAKKGNIAFFAYATEVYSEPQLQSLEPFLQYYLGTRGVTLL